MTSPENAHVSDDLAAYVSRDLTETRRAHIYAHLAICEECSQELAGIMALRAVDFEPMTGPEREHVTTGVRSAVTEVRPGVLERWGRRMAPALGAAALVALAVVGYASFSGSDATDSPAAGHADSEAERGTLEDQAGDPEQGAARSNAAPGAAEPHAAEPEAADTLNMEADQASGSTSAFGSAGGAIPVVQERRFALADLGDLFGARRMRDNFNASGNDAALFAADDPAIATTMEACARTVIETSPDPVVPTYSAHFTADDVIVIAFAWRDEKSGAMTFMLRGWRGRDCGSVSPIYRTGPL